MAANEESGGPGTVTIFAERVRSPYLDRKASVRVGDVRCPVFQAERAITGARIEFPGTLRCPEFDRDPAAATSSREFLQTDHMRADALCRSIAGPSVRDTAPAGRPHPQAI